ncbi:MAG: HRDC domain-containing protein, partial [Myroides sp.]|nr:HRDC domain-containing protein [Myroides sp.]
DLKLTKDGKKFIRRASKFEVPIEVHDEENEIMEGAGATCAAADEVLFSILKDIRRKEAKKSDVPPFVIFQDPSLVSNKYNYGNLTLSSI